MKEEKRFRRFAEIPGINYQSPAGFDFTQLPERSAVPQIEFYDFDGKRHQPMQWKTATGSTGASPAKRWEILARTGESEAARILRQVYETLELPGTLTDYHFALQNASQELQNHIRQEAWVLSAVEQICRWNIRLIETHPETITYESDNGTHYFRVTAFNKLIGMYEKEGYLSEALEIARIAVKFDYDEDKITELEERLAQIKIEDE